jgi:2-oxoglutarate ferredoxin oxidoreductase subunit alpha
MAERVLIHGYEAVGRGALNAGCRHFFGYPITPQNEITEFFARELPKNRGRFVQAESESAVGAMLFGAAAAGVRTMTSTASPGWGLMQEMLSHISFCELPVVVVNCQRGGPGQGTTRHAQTDYLSATRGGGQGGYKSIVLAPASVQECHDLMQHAFYLADKYNILTIVLCDGILIQIAEPVELKTIDFDPLPEKDWALKGSEKKGGRTDIIHSTRGLLGTYPQILEAIHKKYQQITDSEVRYEASQADDAELLLVGYGYVARCCEGAINMARAAGLKVGFIRPITLWPFPYEIIRQKASEGCRFLVVEDSMGQMIEDVKLGAEGKAEIHFLGLQARHQGGELGMLFPETVFEEVKKLL